MDICCAQVSSIYFRMSSHCCRNLDICFKLTYKGAVLLYVGINITVLGILKDYEAMTGTEINLDMKMNLGASLSLQFSTWRAKSVLSNKRDWICWTVRCIVWHVVQQIEKNWKQVACIAVSLIQKLAERKYQAKVANTYITAVRISQLTIVLSTSSCFATLDRFLFCFLRKRFNQLLRYSNHC